MSNIDRFAAEALELNNICYAYEGSTALDSISMRSERARLLLLWDRTEAGSRHC